MMHPVRPPFRGTLLSAPLAAGLLLAACAAVPGGPPPTLPRPRAEPEVFLNRLEADDGAVKTVRGLASVRFEGPAGKGSARQVIVVALPDRMRLEALSPLGTAVLLVTIRGEDLTVYAPARHEYGMGRATPETLGRLARIPVPPGPLMRLLVGLPPLPIRPGDPRLQVAVEAAAIRVESVDGPYWQRVWSGPDGMAAVRGELGEAGTLLLRFEFGERRRLDGAAFPFAVQLDEMTAGTRLAIQYETVRLNEPVEAGLFELPRPADGTTRIIDLGAESLP
jgi:hypothetical protein